MTADSKLPSSSPFQLPLPSLPTYRSASRRELEQQDIPEEEAQQPPASQTRGPPSPGKGKKSRRTSLPFPSLPGARESQFETPVRHNRKYSFYTAEWGSPYDLPSSSEADKRGQLARSRSASFSLEDSIRDDSAADLTEDQSSFLSPSGSGPRTPPRSHSQALDDLDQTPSLAPRARAQRGGLENRPDWSDGSLTSGSEDQRGLSVTSRLGKSALAFSNVPKEQRGHTGDPTLTQRELQSIIGQRPERVAQMSTILSPAALRRESVNSDKPLPPAPHMQTASESPVLAMNNSMESPTTEKRPSVTSGNSFQRPRKKMVWKGKACIIALPLDSGKHEDGTPKRYLQPDEVSAMMQNWKDSGYDTSGFNLAKSSLDSVVQGGRSRESYPEPGEGQSELREKRFTVSIPNRQAWDDYVRELHEAKLRALGVFSADEEPSLANSPAPSTAMSRQASSQNSGAPQSANSLRSPLDSRLSPPVPGAGNSFVRSPSIASPGSQPGAPRYHLARQSMAMPMNQFLGNEPHFPPAVSPFNGSFQQQFGGSGQVSRGISPLVDSRSQSRRATHSPVSPMHEQNGGEFFPGAPTSLPKPPQQNTLAQSMHALRPPPSDTAHGQNTQNNSEPARYFSQPHIASPLPQGHRHNVSESLQREIDEAESHLETTSGKQHEDEAAPTSAPTRTASHSIRTAEASQDSNVKKDAQKVVSDIETNPSPTARPKSDAAINGAAVPASKSTQPEGPRKTSGFVFDPTKNFTPSFSPGMFAFGSPGPQSVASEGQGPSQHSKTASVNSSFSNALNVAAPSFTPGKPLPPPPVKRVFSFTTAMPSLKPDAPAFVPGTGLGISSETDSPEQSDSPQIFQNFNFADIIKQPKKSKAVPILPPKEDSDAESEDDIVEDEDGRATQGEGRQKRARRIGESGNQVPLFASPTPEVDLPQMLPSLQKITASNEGPREELASPQEANGQLKDLLDDLPASTASGASSNYEDDHLRKSSANISELEAHSKTSSIKSEVDAYSPRSRKQEEAVANGTPPAPERPESTSTPTKSKLSATAKPFSFNPSAGSFSPVSTPPQPSQPVEPARTLETPPKKTVFSGGLGASRFAPEPQSSPPRSPTPEKETPAKDTSMESRILNGVSYVEPSYEEIDDVMRHLNGEDSDAGIERNPAEAWRRSSPPARRSRSRSRSRSLPRTRSLSRSRPVSRERRSPERLSTTASPNRLKHPFQYLPDQELGSSYDAAAKLVAENARYSPSYKEPRPPSVSLESPVRRVSKKRGSVSDWGSAISSEDEDKFNSRSGFFDARVHEVVGGVFEKRLQPLQENLFSISATLARLIERSRSRRVRRSRSADVEHSDADDEDEVSNHSRAMSPIKDRKYEKLKQALLEAIAAQHATAASTDVDGLKEAFAELKASLAERPVAPESVSRELSEEFKEMHATLTELKTTVAERAAILDAPPAVSDELKEMHTTLSELKSAMAERAAIPEAPQAVPEELKAVRAELTDLKAAFADRPAAADAAPGTPDSLKTALAELKSAVAERAVVPEAPQAVSDELKVVHAELMELKGALADRPTAAEATPGVSDDFKSMQAALVDLKTALTEQRAAAEVSSVIPDELREVHASLAEMNISLAQQREGAGVAPADADNHIQLMESIAALKDSLNQQHERAIEAPTDAPDQSQLLESIAALKASLQEHEPRSMSSEMKTVIEESISKQMRGRSAPVTTSQAGIASEKLGLQVSGLESMLKAAESRAEEEVQSRRATEDALAQSERKLRAALDDTSQYRESAEEAEKSLRSFLEDQQTAKQHTASLEEVKSSMEKTISEMAEKTGALEDTLDEYRQSHAQDRKDLEETRTNVRDLDEENQNLDRTLRSLKAELEDSVKTKQSLKAKWEKLQDDMAGTARKITQEQSSWRHKESEHKARYELQTARLEAEARTRERLENEIDRLEKQEKEAMKAKFLVEQIRGENNHLLGMVNNLRTKNHELQEQANQHGRDLHDVKESNRSEINRIMNSTKADVAAANQQVELLRSNLENVIERLEAEVDQHKAESKSLKQRYESLLEEASKSRDMALREAAESRDAALQEHYRFHEHTLEETKASHRRTLEEINASHKRAIEELQSTHQRALDNAVEDHQRSLDSTTIAHEQAVKAARDEKRTVETQLQGRIALADETTAHLREHTVHLEERLEIAKSAAQAAAEAAQVARSLTPLPKEPGSAKRIGNASMPFAEGSDVPEKISPQALRESIMVLQEQLHQRESQIEKLEEELAQVDKEAPNKIREREIEITWLRELLGVRLDDLQDIIQQLSQPAFDRDTVRDAAIRLRANLQMEQQEKERAMTGGQRFPSLSSLTASPRAALPLAAAAAWGSWRKGQATLGSLAEMAAPLASGSGSAGAGSVQETPSRSSPQSFFSGLLTPPSTTARHVSQPSTPTAPRPASARRPLTQYAIPKRPRGSAASLEPPSRRPLAHTAAAVPKTPPPPIPLQADDYDGDAPSGHYSLDRYVHDEDEDAVAVDVAEDPDEDLPSSGAGDGTPPVNEQSVELLAEVP